VIENSFGILVSRWRILRKPIALNPKSVDKIVLTTICLHNFLKTVNDLNPANERIYCPPNFIDTEQEDMVTLFLEHGETKILEITWNVLDHPLLIVQLKQHTSSGMK